jgi:hypothetical protein
MTIRSLAFLSFAAALAAIAGCGDSGGTTGALDQSSARPDCAPDDTACQIDGLDAPLAVGAHLPLDVHVTARGVASPKLSLEPARSDVIAVEEGQLVGKAVGWSSIMMVGDDGLVVDFITLSVATPDRVELYRLTESGGAEPAPLPDKIQLAPGDDFEVSVKAFVKATRLLGELDAEWSVDGAVATMLDRGRPGSRRLRIKTPGTAKLKVKTTSFEKELTLEVLP